MEDGGSGGGGRQFPMSGPCTQVD